MRVRCSWCRKQFDLNTEFKDKLSRDEYKISGFCQSCQDKTFEDYKGEIGNDD
jgi:hypothetical protein